MRGRTNVIGMGFINGDIMEYEVAENSEVSAGDFVQKLNGYNSDERNILSIGYFVQGATVYQISEDIILIIHSSEGDLFAHYTTYSFSRESYISLKVSSYIDRYLICSARVGDSNQFIVGANGYNTSRMGNYIELIEVDVTGEIKIIDNANLSSLNSGSMLVYGIRTVFQYSKNENDEYCFMGFCTYGNARGTTGYNIAGEIFTFSVLNGSINIGKIIDIGSLYSITTSMTGSYRARSLNISDNKSLLLFDKDSSKYGNNLVAKQLKLIETTPTLNTQINTTELYNYYPTTNGAQGSYYYGYFCMGRISEQYAAIIVTENEKDSNSMLEGVFDGSKYYLKIYDISLGQIIFSYHFAKDDFLTSAPYPETFFIHTLGNGKFIFGCSNNSNVGMIKAFQFTENKEFKQGKYVLINKFIPQTVNAVCSYEGIPYIIGFDTETQWIMANSFGIDENLNINIENKPMRVMKYYNTIDGIAKQSGQAGDIINVYVPRT